MILDLLGGLLAMAGFALLARKPCRSDRAGRSRAQQKRLRELDGAGFDPSTGDRHGY